MATPRQRAASHRIGERRCLEWQPEELKIAQKAYRSLDGKQQRKLVDELVAARTSELALAFKAVVQVYAGYMQRPARSRKGYRGPLRPRLERTPGVVFGVRQKRRRVAAQQLIPQLLFHPWEIEGKRAWCAVPTDVVTAPSAWDFAPHTGVRGDIRIHNASGRGTATGTLTCLVREKSSGTLYAMSCRHVLGMTKTKFPDFNLPGQVDVMGGSSGAATVTDLAGQFDHVSTRCVDAQLAKVNNEAALNSLLGSLTIPTNGYVNSAPEMAQFPTCFIQIKRDGKRKPQAVAYRGHTVSQTVLSYDDPRGRKILITMAAVLIFNFAGASGSFPDTGDSGSPITTHRHGGKLVGMHIGKEQGGLLAIPAWTLMNETLYPQAENLGLFFELVGV